ncbi:hypothetical protein AC1031_012381 [Aphanomyces cochlioides]|nr:hypothetical protein AC1031_012381 [Aphanomyces cochlioides]
MRFGIAVTFVATSVVVAFSHRGQALPVMISHRVAPLDAMAAGVVVRKLWAKKNQAPRPEAGPKETQGRKVGGRVGKAVVGGAMAAGVGALGGLAGTAVAGPAGTAAGIVGGSVAGAYVGTRAGARACNKLGGWIGKKLDQRDARKVASGVDPNAKKPGILTRIANTGRKPAPATGGGGSTPGSPQRQPSRSNSMQAGASSSGLRQRPGKQIVESNSGPSSPKHGRSGSRPSQPTKGKLGDLLGMSVSPSRKKK